jgi:hypothetical protein
LAQRSRTSWVLAAACLGAGGLLCAAPATLHDRLRGAILDGLKPSMKLAAAVREGRSHTSAKGALVAASEREVELENALRAANLKSRQFEIESARLRDELAQLQAEKPKPFLGEAGLPLFAPDVLTARVLDAPAGDEIERTILTLDEGHSARVALAEWVLGDDGVTIDQGEDSNVLADSPVLAGRSVFGRVASTGRFTSRIQHVSDPAFRAHAKLMRRSGEQTVNGAEGLLVGEGEGVCRLELIAATEPVEPGDLIVTAATIPGIDDALCLGEVQTATLPTGAAHWTIKVTPAVSVAECRQVQVVRVGLHPARKPIETPNAEGASR